MAELTSKSHLKRLGVLLVAGLIGFLVIKSLAKPSSWNDEGWFREDVLGELERQPIVYGGNESCRTCHKDANKELRKRRHRGLSCESCHGALADHVKDNKKFADAKVDKSRWQCENCHMWRINRPKRYPQFTLEVEKHKWIKEGKVCLKCHGAHDPTP